MDRNWMFYEIVVWCGIIVPYRLIYQLAGGDLDKQIRKATPEEVILYKKYA